MPPFLSYSGRGGGNRRRRGHGAAGRATRYSAGKNPRDRQANVKKHQWIRPSETSQENGDSKVKLRTDFTSTIDLAKRTVYEDETESNNEREKCKPETLPKCSHRIMKKNGKHQLILSSKTKSRAVFSSVTTRDPALVKGQQSQIPATQAQILTREGRNKLVSLIDTSKHPEKKREPSMIFQPINCGFHNFRSRQDKKSTTGFVSKRRTKMASPQTILRPTAKRIKLATKLNKCKVMEKVNFTCSELKKESLSTSQAAAEEDAGSNPKPTEKLSDFAYREISRVRPRLRNPDKHLKSKNMGLVRIHPNESNTPICPTFLLGLHCQDQYCRKRHDIPKEYALPICSYFQRHGQCLREETCVFRHVKVNAKALVCPSFTVLGFCEDEKCKMQHVHGQKIAKNVGADGTCMVVTEESTSRSRRKPSDIYHRNIEAETKT